MSAPGRYYPPMSSSSVHRLDLSIVIGAFGMAQRTPRTVHSLSRRYQTGVEGLDYEIIVVDNGSPVAVDVESIEAIGPEVRVIRMEGLGVSPAGAINRAVAGSSGDHVGVVLDGARMVTPGVLALAQAALELDDRALATTLTWHLGPDHQIRSRLAGYSATVEDQLLESIRWPEDGYRLFEIAALASPNEQGWFGPINESCCTFLSRESFDSLAGYDEAFVSPGGGFVNLDFFLRATQRANVDLIVLLGEGSFHQIHGGVASNAADPDGWKVFAAEYEAIRGFPYIDPELEPVYFGRLGPAAKRWVMEDESVMKRNQEMTEALVSQARLVASRNSAVASLNRIRVSRSWRLTEPVRKLSRMARRLLA